MATVVHLVTTPDTGNTPNTSGAFSPAVGDLLVVFVTKEASALSSPMVSADLTSSVAPTGFTLIRNQGHQSSAAHMGVFVADALTTDTTSRTVTIASGADAGAGTIISVYAVRGMGRVGADAVRQSGGQTDQGAGTPAPAFGAAALTGNCCLGAIYNATNPAGLVQPGSWSESQDTGYTTGQVSGLETCFRNSGETGTTITWGGASASAFASIILEMDATSPIAGTSAITLGGSGTLTGEGALAGSGAVTLGGSATLTGAGALAGSTSITISSSGVIESLQAQLGYWSVSAFWSGGAGVPQGSISGAAAIILGGSGTLTGAGALAGTASIVLGGSGTLAGDGALAGTSAITIGTAGTLTGAGALAGTGAITVGGSGTLTGAGALAGAASIVIGGSGTLTGAGVLAGSTAVTIGGAGTLAGEGALAGSATVTFGAAGDLVNASAGAMNGSAALTIAASGTMIGSGALAGTAGVTLAGSGTMTAIIDIAGTAAIILGGSGTLSGEGALLGSAALVIAGSGTLGGTGALAGATALTFSAVGVIVNAGAQNVVLRTFTPVPRSYTEQYDTIRTFTPTPRSYTVQVSLEREPMTIKQPLAPGETRLFVWVFTLAASETGSAVIAAVQNCSLTGGVTVTNVGTVWTVKQLVTAGATAGLQAQVRCRFSTNFGRVLDKTIAATIAKSYRDAGNIDADEVDDVTLIGAPLLAEHAATISSIAVTLDAGTITIGITSNTPNTATARVSAATEGARHRLRYELTLSNSEVVREYCYLDGLTL